MKIPLRAASVTEASRDRISELRGHILYITDHLQRETILESAGESVWTLGTFKGFKKVFLTNSPVKIKRTFNTHAVLKRRGTYIKVWMKSVTSLFIFAVAHKREFRPNSSRNNTLKRQEKEFDLIFYSRGSDVFSKSENQLRRKEGKQVKAHRERVAGRQMCSITRGRTAFCTGSPCSPWNARTLAC